MGLSTYVYEKLLKSHGLSMRLWKLSRALLIKLLGDPSCSMSIHSKILKLPLSHNLPLYLSNHRFYDRLPARLSEYIHSKYGFLKCVDVGANIGDSIAAFNRHSNDIFLAIEPNPSSKKYLHANYGEIDNVKILDYICSSSSTTGIYDIDESSGTASITSSDSGKQMQTKTLDEIVCANPEYSGLNILKIDTDGHDFEVIGGAIKVIARSLPIILFESAPFSNDTYVEDCLKTLFLLKELGYSSFIIYDNIGHLMGKYSLDNLHNFRKLLFYQLTSDVLYFDILVMKEEDIMPFFNSEITYFVEKMPNKLLQRTAKAAAEL